jgi:Cd2+/Zn2+-exporting ATPase
MVDGGLGEVGTRPGVTLRYRVEGMDCASCAGKIEKALGRVDGTGDIRISFQTQVLAFRLDEARTPRAAVEEKVRSLGFGVASVEAPRVLADQDAGGGHTA